MGESKKKHYITMLGKKYALKRISYLGDARGDCDPPDAPNKCIRIASGLKGKEELEVLIHECMHAAQWHLDEEFVEKISLDLANVLWRFGWRKEENK